MRAHKASFRIFLFMYGEDYYYSCRIYNSTPLFSFLHPVLSSWKLFPSFSIKSRYSIFAENGNLSSLATGENSRQRRDEKSITIMCASVIVVFVLCRYESQQSVPASLLSLYCAGMNQNIVCLRHCRLCTVDV